MAYFKTYQERLDEILYAISRESIGVNDGPYRYELVAYDETLFTWNFDGVAIIKLRIANVDTFSSNITYYGDDFNTKAYVDLSNEEKDKYARKITVILSFGDLFPDHYDTDMLKKKLRFYAEELYKQNENYITYMDLSPETFMLVCSNVDVREEFLEKLDVIDTK